MRVKALFTIAFIGTLASVASIAAAETGTVPGARTLSELLTPAQTCAPGLRYCSGRYGASCYDPTLSRCVEGFTCNYNDRVCTEDQRGGRVPYCYNPALPNTCRN